MNQLSFIGKGWDYFKITIVDFFITILSLTLLYPKLRTREYTYLLSKSTMGGIPFTYEGALKDYYRGFFNALFTILLSITFFAALAYVLNSFLQGDQLAARYFINIVYLLFVFILIPLITFGSIQYHLSNISWISNTFSWKGKLSEFILLHFLGYFLTFITLGIYTPWQDVRLKKYYLSNLRFGNLRFDYSGNSKAMFGIFWKEIIFGILTLGIYSIWGYKAWYNYTVNNIVVRIDVHEFKLRSNANTLEVFEMLIGNILICVLTLGLGASFAYIRYLRFMINHCVIPESFNLELIEIKTSALEEKETPKNWLDKWNPQLIF